MFKFRSLVISDQFLKGHISQILEFLEFLDFWHVFWWTSFRMSTLNISVKPSQNEATVHMYLRRMSLKKGSQEYLYQSRTHSLRTRRLTQYSLLFVPLWWVRASITLIEYSYFCVPDFTQHGWSFIQYSAQSGNSATIIVSKSGTCTDTVIS